MMLLLIPIVLAALCPACVPPDGEARRLPRSLLDELPLEAAGVPEPDPEASEAPAPGAPGPRDPGTPVFSIGPAGGYLHAKGADRGTWFAGAQARLHFLHFFAAEGSITFHENSYEHGDVHVTQYPVQVSGMFYPLPDAPFSPYVVGGGGWYYSRITYSGGLSGLSNQTDHTFGAHAGAGLDIQLGSSTSIDADLRYIFLNPSNSQVQNGDFNYWQVTFGLNLSF
jgi:hypothetical protein